jgi:hypothetical protein
VQANFSNQRTAPNKVTFSADVSIAAWSLAADFRFTNQSNEITFRGDRDILFRNGIAPLTALPLIRICRHRHRALHVVGQRTFATPTKNWASKNKIVTLAKI